MGWVLLGCCSGRVLGKVLVALGKVLVGYALGGSLLDCCLTGRAVLFPRVSRGPATMPTPCLWTCLCLSGTHHWACTVSLQQASLLASPFCQPLLMQCNRCTHLKVSSYPLVPFGTKTHPRIMLHVPILG